MNKWNQISFDFTIFFRPTSLAKIKKGKCYVLTLSNEHVSHFSSDILSRNRFVGNGSELCRASRVKSWCNRYLENDQNVFRTSTKKKRGEKVARFYWMTESLGKFYSKTNNLSGIKNEKKKQTLRHLLRIKKENSFFFFWASRINKRKGENIK